MTPEAKHKLSILALVVLAAGAVWFVLGIFAQSPAQKIEKTLRNACEAGQDKSIIGLSMLLSMDYRDESGFDRTGFLGQAKRFFDEVDNLKVEPSLIRVENPEMSSEATEAAALLVVKVSGKERTGGQAFQGIDNRGADGFLVKLRKERGDWKIYWSNHLQGSSPEELMKQIKESGYGDNP